MIRATENGSLSNYNSEPIESANVCRELRASQPLLLAALDMGMTQKADLAGFIRRIADGDHSTEEWNRLALTHYEDEAMETARREAVREALGYGEAIPELRKAKILDIASKLERG